MKITFMNGYLLDGTKNMCPEKDLVIFTKGKKITNIQSREISNLECCKIIDLHNQYIMPGIINLHVHLLARGIPQKKKKETAFSHTVSLFILL